MHQFDPRDDEPDEPIKWFEYVWISIVLAFGAIVMWIIDRKGGKHG